MTSDRLNGMNEAGSPATAVPSGRRVNRRRFSRRAFLRLAGATAASFALGSCFTPQPKPISPNGDKVQLVYQDSRTDWFLPMVQQKLDEFHASHPNIRVFYTPELENPVDRADKMLAEMRAGTAPDVFQGCCDWFPIWAQKGYTLDLRPYVGDLEPGTVEDWDAAQYKSFFTADGRQYALPKYHGALALYYNKDLFDKYGVSYPDADWNHDDYLRAMKALARDQDGDGKIDQWGSMLDISWERIQMHVNGWGGHFVDPNDSKKSRMADPEAMAAMGWLHARMWDDKVMATYLDVKKMWPREAFIAKRVAMIEDGSWALKDVLTGADFRVGIAPFPAGPVRRVTLATTDGFGIYSGTRHPEAAWELIKFLVSKDFGRAMARTSFLQPARASLLDEWEGFIRQEFAGKAGDTDVGAFADGHLKGYSVTGEVAANMAEATRLANLAWEKIFTLGKADVSIMKDVSRQIEEAQHGIGNVAEGMSCC